MILLALILPFTGKFRKPATALAFLFALATAFIHNYFIAIFFFILSLIVIWLSDWETYKYPLFFLAMFDLMGILNSSNLLNLFIYFELAIYASYFLIFEHRDLRAIVRYFIVNAVGSAMMLFSVALSYYTTGSLLILPPDAAIFFALGLLVKLGIAPFQDWLVEIYREASLSTIIFFSAVLTEISPLALLIVIKEPSIPLQVFALFSMLVANLMLLNETSMRRMLALFDASNLAYDLLAISIATTASRTAALFMMFCHVLAMCFAFTALYISQSKTIFDLRAPKGLKLPFYVSFFALSGLPPFHLFPSKLMLFSSVFSASHPFSYILLFSLMLGALAVLRVLYSIRGSREVKVPAKAKIFLYGMLIVSIFLGIFPDPFFKAIRSQLPLLGGAGT